MSGRQVVVVSGARTAIGDYGGGPRGPAGGWRGESGWERRASP